MPLRILCRALFLCAALAGPAEAQTPPEPAPEMSDVSPFVGSWTCQGTVPNEADKPAAAIRSTLTITRDLDDFWFAGRHVREKTSDDPRPRTRLFFWSFDSAMKQFVGGWLDSRGDWLTHTSRGWEGDKLVFVGHIMSGAARRSARETFTRPAANGFTRTFEVLEQLQWVLVAEETCRKGKAGKG
jgi:hypothetical protein